MGGNRRPRFSELLEACQPEGPQLVCRCGTETAVLATFFPGSGALTTSTCIWPLRHRQSVTLDEDAMIAAIAPVHQLTLVTRNVADFSGVELSLLNPFAT